MNFDGGGGVVHNSVHYTWDSQNYQEMFSPWGRNQVDPDPSSATDLLCDFLARPRTNFIT